MFRGLAWRLQPLAQVARTPREGARHDPAKATPAGADRMAYDSKKTNIVFSKVKRNTQTGIQNPSLAYDFSMAARCGLGLFEKLWPWPTLLDANLALAKAGTRFLDDFVPARPPAETTRAP